MQPKSNKFLIPVYYTDTIIYKFNSPLLTLEDFLCKSILF